MATGANSKRTSATKLKAESKCGESFSKNILSSEFTKKIQKKREY
jgi:hypothetical protein